MADRTCLLLAVCTGALALTTASAIAQPPPVPPPPPNSGGVFLGTPQPLSPGPSAPAPPSAPVPPPPAPPPPPPPLAAPPAPVSPVGPAPFLPGPPPPPGTLVPPVPGASPFLPAAALPPGAFWVDGHFFTSVQVDGVVPVVRDRLQAPITDAGGATSTLTVPNVSLSWTVSPRIDVGLRLDNGSEVGFGYRFLDTDGTGSTASLYGPLAVKSRLDINLFDLYYGSCISSLARYLDFKWRAGIQTAFVFYDTQALNSGVDLHASNYFVGAGPEAGMELIQKIPILPAFSFFARGDGSVLVGQVKQNYTQQVPGDLSSPFNGGVELKRTTSVPILGGQFGLSFVPPGTCMKFSLGYGIQQWWALGQVDSARLDLTIQSVFLRGELEF